MIQKIKNLKISEIILILFNIITLIFILAYGITFKSSIASNIFSVIMLITCFSNMIYYSVARRKYGSFMLGFTFFMLLLNYAIIFLMCVIKFKTSISIFSFITLALINLGLIFFVIQKEELESINNVIINKISKATTWFMIIISPIVLTIFALVGYKGLYNKGTNDHEYATTIVGFGFLILTITFLLAMIKVIIDKDSTKRKKVLKQSSIFIAVIFITASFALTIFAMPYFYINKDIQNAKENYSKAFGDEYIESSGKTLNFSFTDRFFGIKTENNYEIIKDIVYYNGTDGVDKGVVLKYDVYVPNGVVNPTVIVEIHGSKGDKGNENTPYRSKYLASKGYIVFDIQIGDVREKDTNFNGFWESKFLGMVTHVDEFFKYAKQNDTYNCNWNSVFIIGNSMGGSVAMIYTLSFENSLEQYGITIKGLIPVYPGGADMSKKLDNYIEQIDKDSPPCLMFMGTHDGVVDTNIVNEVEQKYLAESNPNFAGIWISYAGHGYDIYFNSRGGQLTAHYMEIFINQFK